MSPLTFGALPSSNYVDAMDQNADSVVMPAASAVPNVDFMDEC